MSGSVGDRRAFGLAAVAASLAVMATYLLSTYVSQDDWPQRTAALAFAATAYAVAGLCTAWLARLRGGEPSIDTPSPAGEPDGDVAGVVAGAAKDEPEAPVAGRPWLGRAQGAMRRAAALVAAAAAARPVGAAAVVIALFLSGTVGFALWARGDQSTSFWDLIALWALAIGLYAAPFLDLRRPWRARSALWLRAHRQALLDTGIVLAAASAVRVPFLERWPDIIGGDEGLSGNVARSMVAHLGNPFSTIFAYGNLYHMALAASVAVFGPTGGALRLPNAIAGALAVAATYLAGRELFSRRVGIVAAVLLCVSHMHVHMSRTAHGQAFDTLLAAVVVLGLARGIRRGSAGWMVVAGIGLGLAQYFYVGARVIDVIAVAFVALLAVFDRATLRKAFAGLTVAFGAALVTAVPMIVWAIRRTDDYLTRLNATGFVQTGALAEHAAGGLPTWRAFAGQAARAVTVPIAYPAISFYDATIPMLDLVVGALTVLGVAWALAHLRDWRYALLLSGVAGGVLVLSLGNLVTVAAYRITVVMPFLMLLAAVALVAIASRGLAGIGSSPGRADAATAVVLAGIAGYNLGYYGLVHLPQCRYIGVDTATAAVSEASRLVARTAPAAVVVTLTEPDFNFGAYPNGEYLLGRKTASILTADATLPLGTIEPDVVHAVLADHDPVDLRQRIASARRPVAIIASKGRAHELDALQSAFPGGARTSLLRCGSEPLAEVYVIPAPTGD